ncbi:MAG: glycosyltransferase family 2 protein [Oscillospiraceae bacterium]|nr:glycosyltransferase family 2 protein [Oscillospiraceae bacterium]
MKKIAIITSVKNESDIIEYFCRYNLSYSDIMLVYENHKSSDGTRQIIQKLIDEGLLIFFEDAEDMFYETAKNVLAKLAIEKYGADLVIQLDADELLFHTDGASPRMALENLQNDVEYQISWRTYVYGKNQGAVSDFTPGGFTRYRNPILEEAQGHAGKTLLSKYLYEKKQARLSLGAHWLIYPKEHEKEAKIQTSTELFCAHYPIRSQRQIRSKAITNWINKFTPPEEVRTPGGSADEFQLKMLYDDIKEHGEVSFEKMEKISVEYSLFNLGSKDKTGALIKDLGDDLTLEGALDTSFCEDKLAIRYAKIPSDFDSSDKSFFKSTLSIIETALRRLDAESRAKNTVISELKGQKEALACETDALRQEKTELRRRCDQLVSERDEKAKQADALNERISDIYNSNTWKTGRRIKRLADFLTPWRRRK